MSKVRYIRSPNEIPAGQKYILVMYGEEYAQTRHPLGVTITVANTVSQLSFLTAVHTAKEIAKHEGISEVFVCAATTAGPVPTPSGMFTHVPAHDELSSNVVGLDVYNKDKQNIGTIKDIALDASGLKGYVVGVGGFLGWAITMWSCARPQLASKPRTTNGMPQSIQTLISLGPHQNTNTPANPDQSHHQSAPT
jgi:hypothetical protein